MLISSLQLTDYSGHPWTKRTSVITFILTFFLCFLIIPPNQADVFLYKMSQSPGLELMNPRERGIHPSQLGSLLIPGLMYRIKLGTKIAFGHCSSLFAWEKWNCTFHSERLYRRTVRRITKETALIYSLVSAGISHSIALACASSNISCPCSIQGDYALPRHSESNNCDNIDVGIKLAQPFIDQLENNFIAQLKWNFTRLRGSAKKRFKKRLLKAKINLHNKHVGRQMIKLTANRKCSCTGTSGSCVRSQCYFIPRTFSEVGQKLKEIYKVAQKVHKSVRRKLKKPYTNIIYDKSTNVNYNQRPTIIHQPSDQLLYLSNSKDHCYQNLRHGILGTVGRECKLTTGSNSCSFMCCGRVVHKVTTEESFQCKCKFVWCCKVNCEQCKANVTRYYCGSETHNQYSGIV